VCGILAFIFSSIEIIGFSINKYSDLSAITGSSAVLLKSILKLLAYYITFYTSGVLLFNFLENTIGAGFHTHPKKESFTNNKKSFFLVWGFIFVLWIPYFLKYFPGIVTLDSMQQIYMSLGFTNMTNHHPVLHTLIIGLFMNIGKIFNNYTLGIAMYSVFQMLCLSGAFSYCIYYMAKKNVPAKWRIAILIFFALYPVHALYSITIWKDIPFSIAMLIFIINLIEMCTNKDFLKSNKNMVLLAISILLVILFRNNGAVVIILTIPFMIIMLKQYWKKLIVVSLICVTLYLAIEGPIFQAFNVKQVSVREALSIPLQQFARVIRNESNILDEKDKENINEFFLSQDIGRVYMPHISDSVKACFNDEAFKNNKLKFISTWVKVGLSYPKEYVEAFLCNSYGYWYPETSYWVIFRLNVTSQRINIKQTPIINQDVLGKTVAATESLIDKREIPVFSMMFSIGFTVWIIFTVIMFCIYKKNYKILLVYVPIISLWLTCLASPVFAEFRYAYSLFTCLPLLLVIPFLRNE